MQLVAVASSVILFTGLGSLGDTPDTRSTSAEIADYFVAHRAAVFVAAVFIGVAMMLALVVLSSVSMTLFDPLSVAGSFVRSAATVVAAVVATTMTLAYAGLAYVIGAETPGSAKPLFELTLVATAVIAVPLAALSSTVGIALWRCGHRWRAVVSGGAAAVFVLAATSFASRGALSPDVQQSVVFLAFAVWLPVVVADRDEAAPR